MLTVGRFGINYCGQYSSIMNLVSTYFLSLCSACKPQTLCNGVSDVIVVRNILDGTYRSTPFYACFGAEHYMEVGQPVEILINQAKVEYQTFLDQNGYSFPRHIPGEVVAQFRLQEGKNIIKYKHRESTIEAEVYLYNSTDKMIISDFDGTLTKSDVIGLYSNFKQQDYLHDDYSNLMTALFQAGYKVVWMTMRALPFYFMTKKYARTYVKCDGPIIMEPEEALLALKKESVVRTSDLVKATIIKQLRQLFPQIVNPFAAGFGNRDKDAIAYNFGGMRLQDIYIVDAKSIVQKMSDTKTKYSYAILLNELETHFPKISQPQVRMHTNKTSKP